MSAKKRPNIKTSNILFSINKSDLSKNSENYIGKIRANENGSNYYVYDKGENPKIANST